MVTHALFISTVFRQNTSTSTHSLQDKTHFSNPESLEIIKHFNGEYRENNVISKDMHKIVNWELRCIVEQLCGFIGIESYKE